MTARVLSAEAVDPRDPVRRLDALLDPDTGAAAGFPGDSTVQVVHGRIAGTEVLAYCTDGRHRGGSLSGADGMRIADAVDLANRLSLPVVGIWHSGGARLADGVESMDGVGRMFAAMTRASGRVPQISVVVGPAAGAAAYGPALTDLVVMAESGRMFITGPDVVRQVTGENIDMADLGGTHAHGTLSGVAHLTTTDETEAYTATRSIVDLLANQGTVNVDATTGTAHDDLRALLPARANRAYDVRPLVHAVLDQTEVVELQPRWAPNMVTALGRLGGRTVGLLANNPLRKGGCLDALSAEKAARFVRMCDAFGIPLVVLVDVPGYLPGVAQEWNGVIRRGAKLLHAFAEAVVPRLTLVTRKSYGGAYIAMNSRSLGATRVFTWPGAEVAVMGATAAVTVLHRKALAAAPPHERAALMTTLVTEHEQQSGGTRLAKHLGVVDEEIDPRLTRPRLARALADASVGQRRGNHANIPL
jgi:acetyl-CoA/propionyl-CoA carboxylase carboxyl transferase subunit